MRDGFIVFPKRFEEQAHQYFAQGWCYGFGFNEDQEPVALLVYDGGNVEAKRIRPPYSLKLLP